MRILAIDDEPVLLRLYARILRDHEILTVEPEAGLEILATDTDFDLVLCDLNATTELGEFVAREIQRCAPQLVTRIAICTGGSFDRLGGELLASFGQRVVYKPFDAAGLRCFVESFARPSAEAS